MSKTSPSGLLLHVILLFGVSRAYLSYELTYPEFQGCFPRDTCSVARNDSDDNLRSSFCECGPFCTKHNSCCIDSQYLNNPINILRKPNNRNKTRTENCILLFGTERHVFVVSKCQSNWHGEGEVKHMCEDSTPDFSDPVVWTPTTNAKTGITYKNYFCAICNDDLDELTMWDIKIKILTDEINSTPEKVFANLIFDDMKKVWRYMFDDGDTESVVLGYQMPKELASVVKDCVPNLVSDCDRTWRNVTVRQQCLSYMAIVHTVTQYDPQISTVPFRNIHCAICNFANFTETKCKSDIWNMHHKITPFSGELTFTMLFRPDTFKMSIDMGSNKNQRETKKCGTGQRYDKRAKKCRYSYIPPKSEFSISL